MSTTVDSKVDSKVSAPVAEKGDKKPARKHYGFTPQDYAHANRTSDTFEEMCEKLNARARELGKLGDDEAVSPNTIEQMIRKLASMGVVMKDLKPAGKQRTSFEDMIDLAALNSDPTVSLVSDDNKLVIKHRKKEDAESKENEGEAKVA